MPPERMRWARRYRAAYWLRINMWLIPMLYSVLAIALGITMPRWDKRSPIDLGLSADSVATALNAVATGMIAFTGLVFSVILLIVQFGSTTFSTRLMRWFWRSQVVKNALGVFIATFLFSLMSLGEVNRASSGYVPTKTFTVAMLLVIASVVAFLALLDRMTGLLRVAGVTRELARQTAEVIEDVYPYAYEEISPEPPLTALVRAAEPMATVTHAGEPASLMAIDKRGLTGYAERQNALLELVPAVGQHVGRGAPVLVVHGASPVDENLLRKALIFGEERTIDGDPSFGFRLLVDVAVKALSPAINDPTTVVQVLDRLEDLLRFAGQRRLSDGVERDANDVPRLAFRTPSWNDFLELSLSEIIVAPPPRR